MAKVFRKNFTDNHLAALRVVARLCNGTAQAVTLAVGSNNRNYWRCYLNDLTREGYLTSKLIHATAARGRSGRKIGTLFALTERGADALAEALEQESGSIYYPKAGITATSPFHYPHRAAFLELMAAFLKMEAQSPKETLTNGDERPSIEILDMIPYFRLEGSKRLGAGRPLITVELPSDDPEKPVYFVPDAILRIRVREKIRLIALELHRESDVKKVIGQLRQHTQAIELGLFTKRYHHPSANFVLSVHEYPERLKQVIQRIRNGEIEDFERYSIGFMFATLDSVLNDSVFASFYHIDGRKSLLFTIN